MAYPAHVTHMFSRVTAGQLLKQRKPQYLKMFRILSWNTVLGTGPSTAAAQPVIKRISQLGGNTQRSKSRCSTSDILQKGGIVLGSGRTSAGPVLDAKAEGCGGL